MLLVYADTSALFAYFHPREEFALVVTEAAQRAGPDFIYWSFLKFELRHNLRQARTDAYGTVAWNALRAAEQTRARLRWQDLQAGGLMEDADALSSQHAQAAAASAADWLHVAAARKVSFLTGLDEFWTCDKGQAEAARLAGLVTRLFEL